MYSIFLRPSLNPPKAIKKKILSEKEKNKLSDISA